MSPIGKVPIEKIFYAFQKRTFDCKNFYTWEHVLGGSRMYISVSNDVLEIM